MITLLTTLLGIRPPHPFTPLLLAGVDALIVAGVLFLWRGELGRRLAVLRTAAVPALLAAAGGVLIGAALLMPPAAERRNPLPATADTVAAGRDLYLNNCAACHGVEARGGGPQSGTTPVRPPSLRGHVADHPDHELFRWISEGLPGGMPAWAGTLSEDQIWQIITYLRSLEE